MDIKTARFNADIDEEIFMQQPEGFEKNNEQGNLLVCKLNKSLYGLKQYATNWYLATKCFPGVWFLFQLFKMGAILLKKDEGDIEGMICLWVDDMIIVGTRQNLRNLQK